MKRFVVHAATTALALVVADWLLTGVRIGSAGALLVAAVVLGLVNALVRPLLFVLTLPLTVLTIGLFVVVVNGLAFGLAAALVPDFDVAGIRAAIAAALVVSLVSWFVGTVGGGAAGKRP
jgi:putative membrane protein